MTESENRTMQIVSKVRDFSSKAFVRMGRTFKNVIKFSFLAPLRLLRTSLRAMRGLLTSFATLAIGAFAFISAGRGFQGIVDSADAMSKLAKSVQTTTENLSALKFGFQFAGLSAEQFQAIVTGLGRGISQSLNTGRGAQFEAFSRLGLTLEQLRSGNFVDIFRQIAKGLEQYNTETEKAAILQKIFPDNFQRLIPLLGQGEAAFLANVDAARAFGGELAGPLGVAAEAFNDEMLKLKITLAGVARDGVLGLLRELRPMLTAITEWVKLNREGLIQSLQTLLKQLVAVAFFLTDVFLRVLARLAEGTQGFSDGIRNLADSLQGTGIVLRPFLEGMAQIVDHMFETTGGGRAERSRLRTLADQFVDLQRQMKSGLEPGVAESLKRVRGEMEQLAVLLASDPSLGGRGQSPEGIVRGAIEGAHGRGMVAQLASLKALLDSIKAAEQIVGGQSGERGGGVKKVTKSTNTFFSQFKSGMNTAIQGWNDFSTAAVRAGESLVNAGLNSITNGLASIIDRTATVKEAFRNMAVGIVKELGKIVSQLLVVRAVSSLSSLFGGGNSSTGTSTAGARIIQSGVGTATAAARILRPRFGTPAAAGLGASAGITIVYSPNLYALDGPSAKQVLIREKETIVGLQLNALERRRSVVTGVRSA